MVFTKYVPSQWSPETGFGESQRFSDRRERELRVSMEPRNRLRGKHKPEPGPQGRLGVSMEPRNRIRGKNASLDGASLDGASQWSPETGFGKDPYGSVQHGRRAFVVSMEPRNRIRGKARCFPSAWPAVGGLNGAPKPDSRTAHGTAEQLGRRLVSMEPRNRTRGKQATTSTTSTTTKCLNGTPKQDSGKGA